MVSGLTVMVAAGATAASLAAATAPGGIAPRKVVTCDEAIAFTRAPSHGTRVLLGRVALPPERFPSRPRAAPENRPLPYFAKFGLQIHSGREPVDVVVPRAWRARLALNWGENGGPAQSSSIRVLACGPVLGRRWLAFPGGYFLRKPACVPLIVRVGSKSAHIRLGIGRSC
jgi:hypothetical protein